MALSFSQPQARVFSPAALELTEALRRASHIAIGAHPDDLEFMAGHGIVTAAQNAQGGFLGIVVASGGEDVVVQNVRRAEQEEAARLGRYLAVVTLNHPSADLKNGRRAGLLKDLGALLALAKPEAIYTHNPADKHDTHVAVCRSVVEAVRALNPAQQPKSFWGCEVWRGLDWLLDHNKALLDVSAGAGLLERLMQVYGSQLKEKAYVEATLGRKRANATYFDAYSADRGTHVEYALDMRPLLANAQLSLEDFIEGHIEALKADVQARLKRCL
ncbi:MAG: PIG-L family deacetylase [Bdellovibrionales bacterium]|nr:PIG-L family deacetylase [Bdellovibrionales bacterium]